MAEQDALNLGLQDQDATQDQELAQLAENFDFQYNTEIELP